MEDFSELQSCVRNNDKKGLDEVVGRLKQENRFYHSDYSSIIEVVIESGQKEMIEGVLPLIDVAHNNYVFLSYALRHRLSRDIIELLQPPPDKQLRILENIFMYNNQADLVHWSKSVCSDALNKDIVKIIKMYTPIGFELELQYFVDLVNEDKARKEHQVIASQIPTISPSAKQRKM